MAKGQKRSSREAKKPKQLKSQPTTQSSPMESSIQKITDNLSRGSKTPTLKVGVSQKAR